MGEPKRILVSTDFSECARQAFPYAIGLARHHGAELIVASVVTAYGEHDDVVRASPGFTSHIEHMEQAVRQRMAGLSVDGMDDLPVRRVTLRHGSAAPGITSLAETESVDLIVIATHGRRPITQLLLGSVARGVVATAPCPVLCVREKMTGLIDPASGEIRVRRLLVPTDMSDRSRAALEYALDWTRRESAELHVLHVVHADIPPVYFAGGVSSVFQLDVEMRDRVLSQVESFVNSFDRAGVAIRIEVEEGSTTRQISRYAEGNDIDAIVLTRRGHGETPHLLGGVCERLLHDAPSPMLVM